MKSNQERSNECLPPKKREILALEEKPVVVAPASESQRGENLAWLASVASGQNSGRQNADGEVPLHKPLTAEYSPSSCSSSRVSSSGAPLASHPTLYSSPLSQPGGAIQYAQLPSSLQFIGSAYAGPYTGYISSQIISPTATSAPASSTPRSLPEGCAAAVISQASKIDQHHQLSGSPGLLVAGETPPPHHSVHPTSQYVQIASSPLSVTARAVSSPAAHVQQHLHPHTIIPHALTLAPSQVVVQYTDGPAVKKEEGRTRELPNGETEKGQRYGFLSEATLAKQNSGVKGGPIHHHHHHQQQQQQQQQHHYETQQVMLPADYIQETSGLRTSLMLVPNSHTNSGAEAESGLDKSPSSVVHGDKGGLGLGKSVSRASSFSFSSPEGLKGSVTTLSPHTVIHTTHNASDQLPMGLPATGFYPAAQPPIIGYIAGGQQQQQPVSYHANLPHHVVIPGSQPLLIPVSSSGGAELEPAQSVVTATQQFATVPHAYVTTTVPKCELFGPPEHQSSAPYHAAVLQAQLHLPIIPAGPAPASVLAPPPPASPSLPACPSLPPYFTKGSIIQLADGELKRVEDLKTEDFIQSAEISSELRIDSSTVERIDGSQTPNSAIIQFAVGEHRAQVSVEVLVEYPFFVFGQGWSSCSPDRTTQLFELSCAKLSVGDVCISLTLKNLKNGSLKAGQGLGAVGGGSGGVPPKPPGAEGPGRGRGSRRGEQENGLGRWAGGGGGAAETENGLGRWAGGGGGAAETENGDLTPTERKACAPQQPDKESSVTKKPPGRKRRWSAPEGRKVEKQDEEPPLTLPKPSFIPQEVKICIEGRSVIGK